MKGFSGISLACGLLLAALAGAAPAGAQSANALSEWTENDSGPVAVTVLSPEDVKLYRAIFAAQKTAQFAKADALLAKVQDKTLTGYVLENRYLAGRVYQPKFAELKSWLGAYADHAGADAVYRLALQRRTRRNREAVPAPKPIHWRGAASTREAFADTSLESALAIRTDAKLRDLERQGLPENADALLKSVSAHGALPRGDSDRLTAYVAAAYLAEGKDEAAEALAEDAIAQGSGSAAQCGWTAGLAAYRLGRFEAAAQHFEEMSPAANGDAIVAAAAFWAARSWMHAGHPEHVLALYERAATRKGTFYGFLAARLLGREPAGDLSEPELDGVSFSALMRNTSAHRAVALWQIGRADLAETDLLRAFGEIAPESDPAFAALARHLGLTALELRAAETASQAAVNLTSLYPVPAYAPQDGYQLDPALVLAFARQESRFQADAVSKAGARGLMQIMPATAAIISHDSSLAGANKIRLDDAAFNMTLGQAYLRDLLARQNGNLLGLAAAYNAGEGNLAKWMAQHENNADDPLLFVESVPAPETREYIKRVMLNLWMYRARLGQSPDGLNDVAAGAWPMYKESGGADVISAVR